MKIAATEWFSKYITVPYTKLDKNFVPDGDDWDIIAIHYDMSDREVKINLAKKLKKKTKKLIMLDFETVDWFNHPLKIPFNAYAQELKAAGAILYSATVNNIDTSLSRPAFPWFGTQRCTYYLDRSPFWKSWTESVLMELNTDSFDRPYKFDCLLGLKRPHREIVANEYNASQHKQSFIYSYFKDNLNSGVWQGTLKESVTKLPNTAISLVQYKGRRVQLSSLLPTEIYNKSYYSFVAETTCDNSYSYFTEKIAKPLLVRRPFIVASGQHFLRNLRTLGFKTFGDTVIDESYDSIEDHAERIKAAWQQAERLCQLDPKEVYEKTKAVREHNYNHLTTTDWYSSLRKEFTTP